MSDLFYRNRRLLVLTIALIAVAGISAYQSLPRLEDPELISRNAIVITRFPGADAELVEALVTLAQFEETLTCPVVFAPKESLYLLGATALENFGVDADTTTKQLKPILGIIGGFLASREE